MPSDTEPGRSAAALSAVGTALAAADARLAEADRQLAGAVRTAHAVAVEAIGQLEEVRAEIDAAVARRRTDTAMAGREFSRFLLAKNRQITVIVDEARARSSAEAVALQALGRDYRR